MNRSKIQEREFFTPEEKETIWKKTNGVCAHCGKPIFIGYQFSVDHFIPLGKGGVNRMINLIPLCKDCNKNKAQKVLHPKDFAPYLKEKYKKELENYYESYTKSFNYLTRNSLIAQDDLIVEIPIAMQSKKLKNPPKIKYAIQRAEYCDLDELYKYYVRYLKKYNALDDIECAKANIMYWYESGCLYFIKKNNEVKIMAAFNIVDVNEESKNYGMTRNLDIFIFPYYSNIETARMTDVITYSIPEKIAQEHNLEILPIFISGLTNDPVFKMLPMLRGMRPCADDFDGKVYKYAINIEYKHSHTDEEIRECAKETIKFFDQFEVNESIIEKYRKIYLNLSDIPEKASKACNKSSCRYDHSSLYGVVPV